MGKKSGGKSGGQATDVKGAPAPYSPLLNGDAVLNSATKPARGQGAKDFFSNPDNIAGIVKAGVGLGTGIADMVKKGKGEKGTNEGGGGGGEGGGAPTPAGDEILGMSKPVFFGLVGGIVLIAGVGIFFAVRGGSSASAPAPATA